MKRLNSLLSRVPALRYMRAVEAGVEEEQQKLEEQHIVTDIHARRANWWFFEVNHVTPLVVGFITGRAGDR